MEYELRRSARKTIALQVTPSLQVIVRAPLHMPAPDIEAFVIKHADWIDRHLKIMAVRQAHHPEPTPEQAEALRRQAAAILPERVAFYAARMGVSPAGIKITGAKTRFGSCSGKNVICFSYRLMTYPKDAIDYVVVHELAHIRHHNHSPAFYRLVASILPDYRARAALLKD